MISVLSKFVVANDLTDKVKEAFLNRPHSVDQFPGFVRLEVLSPRDSPNEIYGAGRLGDKYSVGGRSANKVR